MPGTPGVCQRRDLPPTICTRRMNEQKLVYMYAFVWHFVFPTLVLTECLIINSRESFVVACSFCCKIERNYSAHRDALGTLISLQ
jgi:hypothetical protein